jgi:hypothetical protein
VFDKPSLAHPHPAEGKQELSTLGMFRPEPLLEVFLKRLRCPLIQFRSPAGSLARNQSAALIEPFAVTLNCCTVHAEALSSLALWVTLRHRLDYLCEI